MGMVSSLDRTVWSTALVVRNTEFAEILRRARLSPDSTMSLRDVTGWTVPGPLQSWELSFDPALQRTLAAVMSMDILKQGIPPGARDWVMWVTRAFQAVQRISAKCWIGIPAAVREIFLDCDDLLPPMARGEIVDLRRDQPDRPSLRFAGLDSRHVRAALQELYAVVDASSSATRAREAASVLRREPDLIQAMSEVRTRLEMDVRTLRAGETVAQAGQRARRTVAGAYDDRPELHEVVSALRAHNRLVTRIVCVLLGAAEQLEPAMVSDMPHAITERIIVGERHLDITMTIGSMALLRLTHPVWLELETPLDGLYLVERHTIAVGASVENDLGLVALVS